MAKFSLRKNLKELAEHHMSVCPYRCPENGSALISKNYKWFGKLFVLCGAAFASSYAFVFYMFQKPETAFFGGLGHKPVSWYTPQWMGSTIRNPTFFPPD